MISGPSSVIRIVCSNCAVSLPSSRSDRPAVELVEDCFPGAQVQHRLNCEAHARTNDLAAGFAAAEPEVWYAGFLMKTATDAMSLVVSNDLEFAFGRVLVDGGTDIANFSVRLDGSDADPQ